jgi:hypothetical protein
MSNETSAISQLIDGIVDGTSNTVQVSDQIKDILLTKASEKIETIRPDVYNTIFNDTVGQSEDSPE